MNQNNTTRKGLLVNVLIKSFLFLIILCILFFLTAGSFLYWNGWLFLGSFFLPAVLLLIYFYKKDPELLAKRMQMKEKNTDQKRFVMITTPYFLLTFIIPGLDYRFGWSHMPFWLIIFGLLIFTAGYLLFFIVLRTNSFASRIIEIQEGQKVIDSGPYALVRHPMYLSSVLVYFGMPLILGSFIMILPILVLPFALAYRILKEEKFLRQNLTDYDKYMEKVRYRLIPGVW